MSRSTSRSYRRYLRGPAQVRELDDCVRALRLWSKDRQQVCDEEQNRCEREGRAHQTRPAVVQPGVVDERERHRGQDEEDPGVGVSGPPQLPWGRVVDVVRAAGRDPMPQPAHTPRRPRWGTQREGSRLRAGWRSSRHLPSPSRLRTTRESSDLSETRRSSGGGDGGLSFSNQLTVGARSPWTPETLVSGWTGRPSRGARTVARSR
jgi:hypothetical protein